MNLHASHFLLLALCHQGVELGCTVANQSSQVTHKLIDEALALHFADHVSVIVIPAREQENEMVTLMEPAVKHGRRRR